jgi:ribosomal protein L35
MAVGKQRTRRAMAKRVTTTGSGKVMRQKAAHNHRLVPKSKSAKGMSKMRHEVASTDAKNLLKCIF